MLARSDNFRASNYMLRSPLWSIIFLSFHMNTRWRQLSLMTIGPQRIHNCEVIKVWLHIQMVESFIICYCWKLLANLSWISVPLQITLERQWPPWKIFFVYCYYCVISSECKPAFCCYHLPLFVWLKLLGYFFQIWHRLQMTKNHTVVVSHNFHQGLIRFQV